MGWSLGHLQPREPGLLNALFLSAGRALHLANAFESKCAFVLRAANLAQALTADPVLTLHDALEAAPADKLLGSGLRDLARHLALFESWDAGVLDKARQARNYIAHEGAAVGQMWAVDQARILQRAARLRAAVADLAAGDNVVSQWVHGIEEPHAPLPRSLVDAYPTMVDDWVFHHFGDLLDTPAPDTV